MSSQNKKNSDRLFSSISLPTPLIEKIESLVKHVGYWPNKTAFIREACLEKIEKYNQQDIREVGV
jgi:Arc/MetJ-type ribon-helix-helix transcriptional regulator